MGGCVGWCVALLPRTLKSFGWGVGWVGFEEFFSVVLCLLNKGGEYLKLMYNGCVVFFFFFFLVVGSGGGLVCCFLVFGL